MAHAPDGRPLHGAHVHLDRVVEDDVPGMLDALGDPRVWAAGLGGGPTGQPRDAAAMHRWLGLDDPGDRVAYAVRLAVDSPLGPAGRIVGTTSLNETVLADERAHLGWTGYSPDVWGSVVNPECKLLLLGHAFEDCGLGRIKIQCDSANPRSAAAIARLGATREGVLRRHKRRADGSFRDTILFSVVVQEWPQVRDGLRARLAGGRPTS
ncbi:RimJ/RimL family protein N-acetyltransferase [Nakamurella flavida]|uniref:GNAT family N-acetyltransferase n=1 Tax=Nakamurella flavida TaxID=363630 RepID=UPI00278613D3|nr:GNAT family protein [Nakamurella flavida]MDP9777631.1 RimJ/RimL family protein N-acetyltransferase [Nakamurella flavida]